MKKTYGFLVKPKEKTPQKLPNCLNLRKLSLIWKEDYDWPIRL